VSYVENGVVLGDVDEQGADEGVTGASGVDGVHLEAGHAALEVLKAIGTLVNIVSQHSLVVHSSSKEQSSSERKTIYKKKKNPTNKPW